MNKKHMDKKLLAILITIPIISIFISWQVFTLHSGINSVTDSNRDANAEHSEKSSQLNIADTYFNHAEIISFDDTGSPKSKVIGTKISHYPGDKDSEISTPQITLMREKGSPVYVTADQGWINKDASRVILQGHTIIRREKSPDNQFFQLETAKLIIWPNKNYTETDKAVRITTDTTIATGVGMKAYLESEHYYLLNNVKIYHLPKKTIADSQ